MALKYLKPSYDEVRELSLALYHKIRASGWMPEVNVGVGRGGLFVLRSLQDFFAAAGVKIPYQVAAVERYTGIGRGGKVLIRSINARGVRGRRVLVVDDVADNGDSLIAVKGALEGRGAAEVRTATLHVKPWSKIVPDYYVARTDAWIIYPWELYESIGMILRMLAERGAGREEAYQELVSSAHVTPQELRSFAEIVAYGNPLDEGAKELLRELLEVYQAPAGAD